MRATLSLLAIVCLSAVIVPAHAQTAGYENLLEIEPSQAAPGKMEHWVQIVGHNVEDVSGYTIIVAYDPLYVEAVDGNVVDTLSEAVGAEFVNYQDYPSEGFFIIGVLLDLLPPYEGQVIPALPEFDLVFANFVCNVKPAAADVDEIPLVFIDGVGMPPVSNMFVIGSASIAPSLASGAIEVIENVPFVRAEANGDGMLDVSDGVYILSVLTGMFDLPSCPDVLDVNDDGDLMIDDAIYLLMYLFQGGAAIPAPYPAADIDPTPDGLDCQL